ncbi:hypothetical protein EB796_018240 [Bugula neritina]|uniref:PID domain-containing protein n=1 Tax=Bugula neritina TaxID=10212 RepID=A0A7J7JBS1_BUGNE|nr:hypothetical protein EB796_018240 [Bugula neritina]
MGTQAVFQFNYVYSDFKDALKRKQRELKMTDSYMESENVSSEITYPVKEDFDCGEVSDVLERLHIGTLRRDQLKKSRLAISQEADTEEPVMNDEELEEFYRNDGRKEDLQRQLSRSSRTSRTSRTSVGSTVSGQSTESTEVAHSRHSGSNSKSSGHSISTDTQEMGIQTTIGRSGSQSDEISHKKGRKLSSKDKGKRASHRKSSESSFYDKEAPATPMLPRGFVVKYMGVDRAKVYSVNKMPVEGDLPLVNLDVYYEGLAMRPHSKNKIKCFRPVQIPIQFISYGLQDKEYSRIFCFIMVKEMSSQSKSMECHVYACDSSRSARRLAACLALAFQSYTEHLKEGKFRFSINIDMHDTNSETSCDV